MIYVEMAYEMGSSWDGCNGGPEWIRRARVVYATTKKELIKKKKEIEKKVENINISYINVYLGKWEEV